MSTVRDICTAALRRIRVADFVETVPAEDADIARNALNRMLSGWESLGIRLEHQAFANVSDTFVMFVPPKDIDGETMSFLAYQSTWNASTNSPTLVSATGTQGYLYKVATAGSTTLDDVTSWALNDFAVFDGTEWLKSRSSLIHEANVIALLALRLCDEFGKPPTDMLARDARDAWNAIQADYIRVDQATFDAGLIRLPSRRFTGVLEN